MALLIGTGTYQDPDLPDLPAVPNNVRALYDVLTTAPAPLFTRDRCIAVTDPQGHGAIAREFRTAVRDAEDLLLVYYAGHGLLAGQQSNLHLALTDTESTMAALTAFPYRLLRDTVNEARAKARIIILDCCYSGRAIEHMSEQRSTILNQVGVSGAYVLISAPALQVALAPAGATYTTFTGQLLHMLRHGIPGGPAELTLSDIYSHLRQIMDASGLPLPQQLAKNDGGALVLALNRAVEGPPAAQRDTEELGRLEDSALQTARAGNVDEAVSQLRHLVAERVATQGPEHPATLKSRLNLAT